MAAMTQLAKLLSRKRRAAEDGLHSLLTMNNEMSKRVFTEELSFETEVAQTDALSTILLFSCAFSSLNPGGGGGDSHMKQTGYSSSRLGV